MVIPPKPPPPEEMIEDEAWMIEGKKTEIMIAITAIFIHTAR